MERRYPNSPLGDTLTAFQPPIRLNHIVQRSKNAYQECWTNQTKTQHKLNFYLALKRQYNLPEYLFSVRDPKQRKILTKYRLSYHGFAIETGRHKKSWLPPEERVCSHWTAGEVETEMHFLLKCDKYGDVRTEYLQRFDSLMRDFSVLHENNKLRILLGEGGVTACHRMRETLLNMTKYDIIISTYYLDVYAHRHTHTHTHTQTRTHTQRTLCCF